MHFFWLFCSIFCVGVGDYLSKLQAGREFSVKSVVLVMLVNAGSTACWLFAIRARNELAVLGSIWSLVSLALVVVMGVACFHEPLSRWQVAGLVLAGSSVVLLNLS